MRTLSHLSAIYLAAGTKELESADGRKNRTGHSMEDAVGDTVKTTDTGVIWTLRIKVNSKTAKRLSQTRVMCAALHAQEL